MPSTPLRSRSHVIVAGLGTLAAAALGVAIIVVAIAGSHAASLVPGVILLAVAGAGVRIANASVTADPAAAELVVSNPLRTTRVRWEEIRGFNTIGSRMTRGGSFQRQLIVADLKDGRQILCAGVCGWSSPEVHRLLGVLSDARRGHAQAPRVPAAS